MECGTYRHPWDQEGKYNDANAIESIKGKDYVAFSSVPKGLASDY